MAEEDEPFGVPKPEGMRPDVEAYAQALEADLAKWKRIAKIRYKSQAHTFKRMVRLREELKQLKGEK